ncbi:MAG: hypothetical protein A4S16_13580 [Proteobacteria bacterium SG_bin6]|nr:MAG: hypothetical protein A4S16_13580 [Proteobacteria bacterium SG_bin6]
MTDLHRIAAATGGEVRGNSVAFPTPGHSKRDRGTIATLAPNAPDGLLVHSFNGGDPLAIKDQLREKGVLPDRGNGGGEGWRVTGTYEFADERGAVLYRTRRHEHPREPKRYSAERANGNGGWANGLGDTRRVLYRLPELLAADHATPVYLVEGERKADKLARWGFVATAIAFGCKGWRKCYADALAGRTVAILPDNDEPGRKFAEEARAAIEAAGGRAFVIELPGLPQKGDVMDWRGTPDELRALTDAAINRPPETFPLLDLAALAAERPQQRAFALATFIPLGELTLFTGPGGAGKSLFGQQLATSIAAGLPFLGLEAMRGRALYVTAEDDERELHWRQDHIARRLGVVFNLPGLFLASLRGRLGNELCTFDAEGRLRPSPAFKLLGDTIRATGASFVVLDNVAHLFTGNENDRGQVTQFANLLHRLGKETGATILLVAHPNKNGDSYSGSTAWLNAVRSQIVLDWRRDGEGSISDPDARELKLGKANYARAGETLAFRWHDFALVRDDDLPADTRAELAATIQATGDNELFLRCLDERNRQERTVSDSPASRTYAPKVFADMAESKRIGRARLEAAMERLFKIGAIERGFVYRDGAEGKDRFGLRRPPADLPADLPPTPSADLPLTTRRPPLAHTPYTTYMAGGADGGPPPAPDDIGDPRTWGTDE